MKTAVALRHVAFETVDGFAPALSAAGFALSTLDLCDGAAVLEKADGCDLLIVLGGPISANDEDRYPFLAPEIGMIEKRIADDRPVMGICLGAQLIARALGARVYPAARKEIGFGPIDLTPDGGSSCLAPFTKDPITLHWHGETFDLPDGAVRLASTGICENQAFAYGDRVVGFQFHPEATGANIEHWLVGHAAELDAAGIDVPTLRADAVRHGPDVAGKADAVMRAWLASIAF